MERRKNYLKRIGSALLIASMVLTLTPQFAGAANEKTDSALSDEIATSGDTGILQERMPTFRSVVINSGVLSPGADAFFTATDETGVQYEEGALVWSATDGNGNPIPGITINELTGIMVVDSTVRVGTQVTVTAKLGTSAIEGKVIAEVQPGIDYLTIQASDFSYNSADGSLTNSEAATLANVSIRDMNGNWVNSADSTEVTVNALQLAALNAAIVSPNGNGNYPLTFTNVKTGQAITVTATLQVENVSVSGLKDVCAGDTVQYTAYDSNGKVITNAVWSLTNATGQDIQGFSISSNGVLTVPFDLKTPLEFEVTAVQGNNYGVLHGLVYAPMSEMAIVSGGNLSAGRSTVFTAFGTDGEKLTDGVWSLENGQNASGEANANLIGTRPGDNVIVINPQSGRVAVGSNVPVGSRVNVVYTPSAQERLHPGSTLTTVQPTTWYALTANDITYVLQHGTLTVEKLRSLAGLTAYNNVESIENPDWVTVSEEQLDTLNAAITNKREGRYPITFVDPTTNGKITIQVSLVNQTLFVIGPNLVYNNTGDTVSYIAILYNSIVQGAVWQVCDLTGNTIPGMTINSNGILTVAPSVPVNQEFVVTATTDDGYYGTCSGVVQEKPGVATKLTVTFSGNGRGSVISRRTRNVYTGSAYGTLPSATREGYLFTGWFTAPTGGTLVTADTIVTIEGDHVLYAHWTESAPIRETVTFSGNGSGSVISRRTRNVYTGSAYGALPTASRTGYTFLGWFTEAEGGTQITENTIVTIVGNHALYAHWAPVILAVRETVTFSGNGRGSVVSRRTRNVYTGSAYGTLPTATREGYTFEGWYTAAVGGTRVTEDTIVTIQGDHVLYAHWGEY